MWRILLVLSALQVMGAFILQSRSPRRIARLHAAKSKEDQLADMVQMIVQAVDEGKEADLEKAGLKVTARSALDRLSGNLESAELVDKVLGSMSGEDEQEVLGLLESALRSEQEGSSGSEASVNALLLAELRAEAEAVTKSMQDKGGLAKLLDEDTTGRGFESSLRETRSGGDALPSFAASSFSEQEIDIAEEEGKEEKEEEEERGLATVAASTIDVVDRAVLSQGMSSIEAEGGLSEESRALAQTTFAQLLKATMDSSEASAPDAEEETVKQTLAAVSSGDYSSLDIKSLLGETLGTLAEELGIDVKGELGGSQNQGEMQAIIASSMAELATNMAELDEQSMMLYQKLGNLEEELRMETEAFDMQKSSELEELLGRQAVLQGDISSSRQKVQATSEQLEKLMADLDEKADTLTALALFPIKSTDKKVAFVLGLALLFKVPFDALQLFAVRSLDPSDWFGVLVQTGLCAAFFNHYGLVKSFFQPKTNLGFLPPPPDDVAQN